MARFTPQSCAARCACARDGLLLLLLTCTSCRQPKHLSFPPLLLLVPATCPATQVLVGVRQVEVTDYEVLHSYNLVRQGLVEGRQRSALYLQPQQPLYFEAGGRAVAVYDYSFTMRLVPPPADAPGGAVACVPTPKSFVQCL